MPFLKGGGGEEVNFREKNLSISTTTNQARIRLFIHTVVCKDEPSMN